MSDFTIKRGDRLPSMAMTLTDADGAVVNLTGSTVRVLMGKRNQPVTVDAAATVVSAAAGTIRYDWATGDTASAGTYLLEVEVTFADGRKMTCPNDGYATVRVVEDLG